MNQSELNIFLEKEAKRLGFAFAGIADLNLIEDKKRFSKWLAQDYHADMSFMEYHQELRFNPENMGDHLSSAIVVGLNYDQPSDYISAYALGRDYHRIVRSGLKKIANILSEKLGEFEYRICCDSAPIFEKGLLNRSGLGWIGKNTLFIHKDEGSFCFLGVMLTSLSTEHVEIMQNQCAHCERCIKHCPTGALIGPGKLDARRCIAYLTIEHKGVIPVELRPLMGAHLYGCDDCQRICPYNQKQKMLHLDLKVREIWAKGEPVSWFLWDEAEFLKKTEGSVIRRLGYERWQRNLAVVLGNMPKSKATLEALKSRLNKTSVMVDEHIQWALEERGLKIED